MFPDKLEIFSNEQIALILAASLTQQSTRSTIAIIDAAVKFKRALDLKLDEDAILKTYR